MNRMMRRMMLMGMGRAAPIPLVPTLPADASLYAGQVRISPRWPLVGSLPGMVVGNQRWRIPEAGQKFGREYLGRSVVELTTDRIDIPFFDYTADSWEIEATINDVNIGVQSWPTIWNIFGDAENTAILTIFALQNSTTVQGLFGLGAGIQLNSVAPVFDGKFHNLSLGATGNTGYMKVDGVITNTVDITAWRQSTPVTLTHNRIYDSGTTLGTTPLQVASVRQSVNGVLIDNIPCTETTGTELANTANPLRPATLSSADAHALAWFPQPSVTMGLWQSDGTDWIPL